MVLMKFGLGLLPVKPWKQLVDYAKLAEISGFEYVWVADVDFWRDPFITATLVALGTERINIGLCGVNPYSRNPGLIALGVATLDEVSAGRALLCFGPGGFDSLLPLNIKTWDRPLMAMRDSIQIARRLFTGESVTYNGGMFALKDAQLTFKPRRDIKIYLTVMAGPKMTKLAGELADGVIFADIPLEFAKIAIEGLREAASKAGRNLAEIDVATWMSSFFIADEEKEALTSIKPRIAKWITDSRCIPILKSMGVGEDEVNSIRDALAKKMPHYWRAKFNLEEMDEMLPDDLVRKFAIAGTAEQCVEKIEEFAKLGINQIVFDFRCFRDPKEGIEKVSNDIMPLLF